MAHYRFADFEFDPGSYQLRRGQTALAIEPKVAELLHLLIEHRSRVVSRRELFDQLWPNQEVSDASLSRLLYELRKALDDDADNPRFVRTVPRRGVQFVGALTEPEPSDGLASAPASTTGPAAASRAQRSVRFIAAFGVLLVGILGALWLARDHDGVVRTAPDEQNAMPVQLGILNGVSAGADAQAQMVLVTVGDLLWARLSSIPGIEVRSPFFTTIVSQLVDSVSAFAAQSQVEYVLSMSVAPSSNPDQVTLTAELMEIRAPDGDPIRTPLREFELPTLGDDGDLAAFLVARDLLVANVAEEIGALVGGDSVAGGPTSVEAWRLYLLAREEVASLSCSSDGATRLLERVVELDPDFYLGWIILGSAHYNAVWACGAGRGRAEQVLAALDRAESLKPGASPVAFLRTIILAELGEIDDAVATARQHLARTPGNSLGMVALGYALTYQGELAEAASLTQRAVESDPLVLAIETGNTPTVFLHLGQYDTYLELAPAGDGPIERYYQAWAQWQLGDVALARQVVAQCGTEDNADTFARLCMALSHILEGNREAAATVVKAMQLERSSPSAVDGEIDFKLAQLLSLADEPDAALDSIRTAWERGFRCRSCYEDDPAFEALRGNPAVQTELARILQ